MNNILKGIGLFIVGTVVGGLLAVSFFGAKSAEPTTDQTFGGVYSIIEKYFADGISVGQSSYTPANITLIKMGTCTLLANSSITATSTGSVDCAVTGARSGDIVVMQLAASTTLASQYVIKSTKASTTADYITAQLINLTGTTATPSATNGFGSSTAYQLYRTR